MFFFEPANTIKNQEIQVKQRYLIGCCLVFFLPPFLFRVTRGWSWNILQDFEMMGFIGISWDFMGFHGDSMGYDWPTCCDMHGFLWKCRGKTSKSHGLENLWPYENVRLWRFYVFRHTPVTKNVQQQTVGIMSSLWWNVHKLRSISFLPRISLQRLASWKRRCIIQKTRCYMYMSWYVMILLYIYISSSNHHSKIF